MSTQVLTVTSFIVIWYLDICHISGIFTVPVSGVWRLTFSMWSRVSTGDVNLAWLFINGRPVNESQQHTFSSSSTLYSTDGREVTREFSQGDNIELRTTTMDGGYTSINFCAEYVPKM